MLYQYFITHADRGSITPKEIRDYYLSKNIEVHTNTIYADISAIQGEVFGLQIDFDKRLNGGAGAYVLKNPPFTSDDLRLLADSVQASKFITQKKADELTGKINRLGSLRISGKATVVDRILKHELCHYWIFGHYSFFSSLAIDNKILILYV